MKERIRQLMLSLGMNQQEFSNRIGISTASISSILNGRTNPTNNHVRAIHDALPEVNIDWLLFGEGEMYREGFSPIPQPEQTDGTDGNGNAAMPTAPDSDRNTKHEIPARTQAKAKAETPQKTSLATEKKNDKSERRITEIHVFYSDGTYESIVPVK